MSHEDRERTRIEDVCQGRSEKNTVAADADANEALTRMQQARTGRLMVADGDRLVGILVLKDLLHFLDLRAELERD
ncbi:MAG: CBS domain-containing protein [Thioalkalivibrio sp.]|nr:CBS domain-containing protein [Thioalkalivibrio sp.]